MSKYDIDLDYAIFDIDITEEELEEIKADADKIISENKESKENLALAYLKKAQCRRKLESGKTCGIILYDDYYGIDFLVNKDEIKLLLERALELSPNMPETLMQLGLLNGGNFVFGDQDKAKNIFTRAIQLKPDYAAAFNNRAMIFYNKMIYFIESSIQNKEPRIQDKERYEKLKINFRNAVADLTEAILLRPFDALYHLNRGIFHSRLEEHREAIEDFSKAIDYASDALKDKLITEVNIFNLRGKEYLELEDYTKAIEDFSGSLCILQDYDKIDNLRKYRNDTLLQRGKAYYLVDKKNKAKTDFENYLDNNHEDTDNVKHNKIFELIGVMPEDIL
jgi:tetratricopeptide (TPR) repeat protein